MLVQRIFTNHDANGNSRALYFEYYPEGDIRALYKENSRGKPKELYNHILLPEFMVSPKEFRYWLKIATTSDKILYYD